jgi:hypothetical protein
MAYWMVACSVYLYVAILGANVRFCRESRGYSRLKRQRVCRICRGLSRRVRHIGGYLCGESPDRAAIELG